MIKKKIVFITLPRIVFRDALSIKKDKEIRILRVGIETIRPNKKRFFFLRPSRK